MGAGLFLGAVEGYRPVVRSKSKFADAKLVVARACSKG
jgi:hypothetical protein